MERLYESPDDFEAVVRILFRGEDECSIVWPEFLDETGDVILLDPPLAGMLRARFYVVAETMRDFHRQHARPGVGSFCAEGAKVCAAGVVTRITGLAERTGTDALPMI